MLLRQEIVPSSILPHFQLESSRIDDYTTGGYNRASNMISTFTGGVKNCHEVMIGHSISEMIIICQRNETLERAKHRNYKQRRELFI